MRIIIGDTIEVAEVSDLQRLGAHSSVPPGKLSEQLSSVSWIEMDGASHLRVCPKSLEHACFSSEDALWKMRFKNMLEWAESHGYVDARGWLRVHLAEN